MVKQFRAEMEEYEEALAEWEKVKRQPKGEPGEKPMKPILPRVVCSDTTIEKFAAILEDNRRGTLIAVDELAGWLASFTRYKGKARGERSSQVAGNVSGRNTGHCSEDRRPKKHPGATRCGLHSGGYSARRAGQGHDG